jgi:hypothetical protein
LGITPESAGGKGVIPQVFRLITREQIFHKIFLYDTIYGVSLAVAPQLNVGFKGSQDVRNPHLTGLFRSLARSLTDPPQPDGAGSFENQTNVRPTPERYES